eukprot:29081-Pelagococcus_subviridis.AAC.10
MLPPSFLIASALAVLTACASARSLPARSTTYSVAASVALALDEASAAAGASAYSVVVSPSASGAA